MAYLFKVRLKLFKIFGMRNTPLKESKVSFLDYHLPRLSEEDEDSKLEIHWWEPAAS